MRYRFFLSTSLIFLMLLVGHTQTHTNSFDADVIIYGGTSASITAALQLKKMNKSVIIVSPDKHLGGLTTGGLGETDTGKTQSIGGLARDFYHKIWLHYQSPENWTIAKDSLDYNWKKRLEKYDLEQAMWRFEPHVAEAIFNDDMKRNNIVVHRNEWLDRENGVTMKDNQILSFKTLSGKTYSGRQFMDTTYEGDLMASVGVAYHVGREANSVYGESWNGIQVGTLHHEHNFKHLKISPYVIPNDPTSGVIPRISTGDTGPKGEGDFRVQAYCFRMCLTNDPNNRIPFEKPLGYDRTQYELLARILDAGWKDVFKKFDSMPNMKTDTNNHGPFSTDNIGYNYDYPNASYERRFEIIREHEIYQKGLMYFLANDPRVPESIRTEMSQWGLPKDEFKDNSNWPHQLYIREARRMIGTHIMTEHDILKKRDVIDSIGMGSYTIDSHNVQRYIKADGTIENEGDIGVKTNGPYKISYGSILPKREQCKNLTVPVCVSSTHIAFGSIRMEPVFMILGQSAATAAALSLDQNCDLHNLDYNLLKTQLLKDSQVLE